MSNPPRNRKSQDEIKATVDYEKTSSSKDANHVPHQANPQKLKFALKFLLVVQLFPGTLLAIGLAIFTQSFFLSRTSFDHRSPCEFGSAGKLLIDSLGVNDEEIKFLRSEGWISDFDGFGTTSHEGISNGCWVPRRVDSMALIVVDALRFDFATDHLPLSIGSRLYPSTASNGDMLKKDKEPPTLKSKGVSQLFQFVADPPTVTMQRLKGLTTGGLPTFADITGSFGGASIDEDSWVEQLKNVPWHRRHVSEYSNSFHSDQFPERPRIAFVGDDTWVDLFPTQFDDCHPYPSFNTRDLDTVDNGCLQHLPRLLNDMVGLKGTEAPNDGAGHNSSSFELVVAHFLGVDHVGHTYGPNDPHMESKLHQMDVMLSKSLEIIDDAPKQSCIVALVLGDHGMTEDGNHGGGSSEEVNAGLFVHFSPGCLDEDTMQNNGSSHINFDKVDGQEVGRDSVNAFESIHQIDLVPTISLLLGLPIPFANIGGLVPALLPSPRHNVGQSDSSSFIPKGQEIQSTPQIATALALNSAQVWSYLHAYSKYSRDLPSDQMAELKELLDSASMVYRDALFHSRELLDKANSNNQKSEGEEEGPLLDRDQKHFGDSMAYRQACGLFKLFLAKSTDLGKRVWTQFNERGMAFGITLAIVAWIMAMPLWRKSTCEELSWVVHCDEITGAKNACNITKENTKGNLKVLENDSTSSLTQQLKDSMMSFRRLELAVTSAFMIFQCAILTFGNSYIDHERDVVTFFLSVICLLASRRWYFCESNAENYSLASSFFVPLVIPLCCRMNDIFVTGHGLDPSIQLHQAHHPFFFSSGLFALTVMRLRWVDRNSTRSHLRGFSCYSVSTVSDIICIVCLALSWWEKRARDHSRNGYIMARAAIVLSFVGLLGSLVCISKDWTSLSKNRMAKEPWIEQAKLVLFRVMMFLVIVTGPSTAPTAVLVGFQSAALFQMMEPPRVNEIDAPVMAAIFRLVIRHIFYATNHHCSFNRLQYSAAFVATNTFYFSIAGISLFLNTFGWEIIGSALLLVLSRTLKKRLCGVTLSVQEPSNVWLWFCFFQWTEMVASCLSVSVMKRHLMVWAIFAPRFMFATVFTVLNLLLWCFGVLSIADLSKV